MPPLVFEGSTSRVTPETLQNIMKPAVEKSAITAGVDNSITSLYNRAHTLVNVGKHTDAMVIYKDLLNRTDFKFDSERKLVENSLFQLSVCLLKQTIWIVQIPLFLLISKISIWRIYQRIAISSRGNFGTARRSPKGKDVIR